MSNNTEKNIIICENLVKIYGTADVEVVALQGLDLLVEAGEIMAIIGNSGSGKSTLLNMMGGLDRPSAGKLLVNGRDMLKFSESQMIAYRRKTIGFVWQKNVRNLIPYLTVIENVELPMVINGTSNKSRSIELLEMVGLSHKKNRKIGHLSGGEQQRVAIAIALANNPMILLADEPTGAVDSKTAEKIMDVFRELNAQLGLTVIIVTHDRQLSRKVNRVVAIKDGRTSSEFVRKKSYAEELSGMEKGIRAEEETHEELVVFDRHGRIQVPEEYLITLGFKETNKAKIKIDGDRIVIMKPGEIT